MEIVNIDAELFEKMLSKLEGFIARMETLCRLHAGKDSGKWLDNQDVCLLLSISQRTLQTLRDNGTLGFSKISRKVYYKPEDVEKIIPLVDYLRKAALRKGKQI
ncbi:helix-turn-helix domain-containing protein [Dysgonomonas sp. GY75]|uniref:helix-turn-helix domain-containing protein n=1 Tax=Dysgonomonas sp. GY75 TaxID=2780419 RepID=UPI0018841E56|nr:helix-turn-helix domain-containing protein [Dysgonomonas sp. GY75]MBF0649263.1 helix-turn-helix domain-containing protein [Dysgonomonas sp. GY75]